MVFSAPIFLFLFLPIVLAGYFVPPWAARNLWLLIASLLFYAWGEPTFLVVMAASIATNYVFGLTLERFRTPRWARVIVTLAIAVNIGLLAFYKYADFIAVNVAGVLRILGHSPIPLPAIALPLGISFFTFHALSYVIDVYRRDASAQRNPITFALYIALFPQLIAGPIIRYHDIADQLIRRRVTTDGFAVGVRRFVIGLGKKLLIANTVAAPADKIFAIDPSQLTCALSWYGVLCYTVQIYFDFSGYSDMAIGLGHMFGFTIRENFNYPYISASLTEFWRRWHISLSTWFRDYLYIPLGGNRCAPRRVYFNLVTIFFLCGLWHGASWTFVAWGLFHGAFLVIERRGFNRRLAALPASARHAYTLSVVMVGWVLFRAPTFSAAGAFLLAMVGLGSGTNLVHHVGLYLDPLCVLALVAGVLGSTPWHEPLRTRVSAGNRAAIRVWNAVDCGALALVLAASILQLSAGTYNPFIYFRF